jgi:hypothetical protein
VILHLQKSKRVPKSFKQKFLLPVPVPDTVLLSCTQPQK